MIKLGIYKKVPSKKKVYEPKAYQQMKYPGQRVQVDVKYVPYKCLTKELREKGERYYQYTAIDEYTRLRVLWFAKEHSTYESSKFAEIIVKRFPFKIEEVQTDNGFEFTNRLSYNTSVRNRKTMFENKLEELGIKHKLIKPYTPRHNGKVERSHRKDQERFYYKKVFCSFEEFEQVQDIIYNRDIKINKNKKYDVFSGHIKCADCGNALTIFQSKKYEYYYCASYMRKKSCLSNHSIKKELLNEIVLKMINKQIELVKEIDNKIENIVVDEEVNYDIEILNNRIVDIDNHIVKYKKLKNDIRNDYIGNFINKEDYTEYKKEYDSYLKQYVDEKNVVLDKLNNIDKKSSKNKFWIYKYINNSKIEKLSKKIVDELIEDIIVYKNGNIKIIFKYNDEYNEALDFINSYQCDIIGQEIYAN